MLRIDRRRGPRDGDSGEYPDIDMVFDAEGYARKDGTRYDTRRTRIDTVGS